MVKFFRDLEAPMTLRRVPKVDDGFRLEPAGPGVIVVRRDYVWPVPVGTLIVKLFRVEAVQSRGLGRLRARLASVDLTGQTTGWVEPTVFLSDDTTCMATDLRGDLPTFRPYEMPSKGQHVARIFRVVGYTPDCDGEALATLTGMDLFGQPVGWRADALGLSHETALMIDSPQDLRTAAETA